MKKINKFIALSSIVLLGQGMLPQVVHGQYNSPEELHAELPEWDVTPETGIVKGDYYYIEERFRQGHLGSLEVVKDGEEIVHVEFNELTRPNYYNRYFQDVPKRMSEYNADMYLTKGAGWIQSVLIVEDQMIENQSLTGDFDVVAGASNSINQSFLPLAEQLEEELDQPSTAKYYSIAEEIEEGVTAYLKVVMKDGEITKVSYDEIFASSPDEIESEALKSLFRQSKYHSIEYDEPSRIGFNIQMDALNEKVVETQDLLDIEGLPATGETGDYASSGFTTRNPSWDTYLDLAEKLLEEINADLDAE